MHFIRKQLHSFFIELNQWLRTDRATEQSNLSPKYINIQPVPYHLLHQALHFSSPKKKKTSEQTDCKWLSNGCIIICFCCSYAGLGCLRTVLFT